MKVWLMHRDRDFELNAKLPSNTDDLIRDLELELLFKAMAGGDSFLFEVAKTAVVASLDDSQSILYRQHILADCVDHADVVRELYDIAVNAIERERKVWGWMSIRYPEGTLHRALEVLEIFVSLLKKLRKIAEEQSAGFRSEGFCRLFEMLRHELAEEYIKTVEEHMDRLRFRQGLLMSATLGKGNKGVSYVVRKPWEARQTWGERLQQWLKRVTGKNGSLYYEIADRDEAGFRALSDLKSQGIAHIAGALAQSTDHILSFFRMLRLELGFYIGCLNLREKLIRKGEPVCAPNPLPPGTPRLSARGLYDVSLSLNLDGRIVGNEVTAGQKALIIITGANRGGKSTFLRSLGQAHLMMQCGMFVAAESFSANVCRGIFTHFKREEDAKLKSGKLDEELSRMSTIVDRISPESLVLLNESFASTNEREGSEIARQIVRALLESGIKVFYVTHMFDLARSFWADQMPQALFLRAERLEDRRRTFRMVEGEPLPTSYGVDLFRRIFGAGSPQAMARELPRGSE
jgi:DNA mismatch repair ATPase MutS